MTLILRVAAVALLFSSNLASALDSSAVLPKGVRRVYVRTVSTEFEDKSGPNGSRLSVANALNREVTFKDFVGVLDGSDKTQLEAFLLANDKDQDEAVGTISAEFEAVVNVFAPSFAVGVTDRFNIGLVLPIYDASTSVKAGFKQNENAKDFVATLNRPQNGQQAKAIQATNELNNVIGRLNNKLASNGYERLGDWHETGIGDAFIKAKYLHTSLPFMQLATHGGVVAPTGRTDDPDNLTDIPFGDGSWDIFVGETMDFPIWGPIFANLSGQYTLQLPAEREVRLKREDEPLAVPKKDVDYDLGDKVDTEASVQFDTFSGIMGGVGYAYARKFSDSYSYGDAGVSAAVLEQDTETLVHTAEAQLGYSSVKAYRRQTIAVPFETSFTFQKQLRERYLTNKNAPIADRYVVDLKIYF